MSTPANLVVAESPQKRAIAATPIIQDSAALMTAIAAAAMNPRTDVAKMERLQQMFERMESRAAEAAFNEALSAAQAQMRPVATDADNDHTHSKYATYAALDRAIRPIYTGLGLSISYDTADSPKPDHVRVLAYVARGGYSRTYRVDMPADGKGTKGNDVMTKTHASGAANSYGMRYLLKMIFNIAVGEDDTDGNDELERITDHQVAELSALITEVGASKDALLSWLKLERLADIPAERYTAVVRAVEQKRAAPKPASVRR